MTHEARESYTKMLEIAFPEVFFIPFLQFQCRQRQKKNHLLPVTVRELMMINQQACVSYKIMLCSNIIMIKIDFSNKIKI